MFLSWSKNQTNKIEYWLGQTILQHGLLIRSPVHRYGLLVLKSGHTPLATIAPIPIPLFITNPFFFFLFVTSPTRASHHHHRRRQFHEHARAEPLIKSHYLIQFIRWASRLNQQQKGENLIKWTYESGLEKDSRERERGERENLTSKGESQVHVARRKQATLQYYTKWNQTFFVCLFIYFGCSCTRRTVTVCKLIPMPHELYTMLKNEIIIWTHPNLIK